MKIVKVNEAAHKGVKIEAARTGRTSSNVATALLLHGLDLVRAGKLDLGKMEAKTSRKRP